jgi:hypothetical protein
LPNNRQREKKLRVLLHPTEVAVSITSAARIMSLFMAKSPHERNDWENHYEAVGQATLARAVRCANATRRVFSRRHVADLQRMFFSVW